MIYRGMARFALAKERMKSWRSYSALFENRFCVRTIFIDDREFFDRIIVQNIPFDHDVGMMQFFDQFNFS